MKTIEEFLNQVREAYARLVAYGRWEDRPLYNEDEAWRRAFLDTSKYYKEVAHERSMVAPGDHPVAAGGGRVDEAVQVLDKEGKMMEELPGAAKESGWTQEFKDEVYSLMYKIDRELDLRLVLDDRMQEASRRLIQAWREAHPGVEDCVFHRCQLHYSVPQLNSSAPGGVECGACTQESARHIALEVSIGGSYEATQHHQMPESPGQHLAQGDEGMEGAVGEANRQPRQP